MRFTNLKNTRLKYRRDENGDTALTLASWNADLKTVKFLIEELQMDINAKAGWVRSSISVGRVESPGPIKFQKKPLLSGHFRVFVSTSPKGTNVPTRLVKLCYIIPYQVIELNL